MKESEIILVDGIEKDAYAGIIDDCVRYALISLPFTVDRMRIKDEAQRALNIAKGKVAEALFRYFCDQNGISLDFETPATPFWTVDKRDFMLNGKEWDIKNNFIYHAGERLDAYPYTDLPALVPNRFKGDQWSKRKAQLVPGSKETAFLFTFLKNAPLNGKKRGQPFLEIVLTNRQKHFLRALYDRYQGQPQTNEPFSENDFWQEMQWKGSGNLYRLHFRPHLVITGYAGANEWYLFTNTGRGDTNNRLMHYIAPRWYVKKTGGACNFLQNTLWTKITNATLPVSQLPSFLSLFPGLQHQIRHGRILD